MSHLVQHLPPLLLFSKTPVDVYAEQLRFIEMLV